MAKEKLEFEDLEETDEEDEEITFDDLELEGEEAEGHASIENKDYDEYVGVEDDH